MLRTLSALVISTSLICLTDVSLAQVCPYGTFGVYFDPAGGSTTVQPVQNQELVMYVILFAEAPVAGAAWQIEMTSDQYSGVMVGPPGPNCQPPWCAHQDPPFWILDVQNEGVAVLGDPFFSGIRQGFGDCRFGFFGQPVLLSTITLYPWANILGRIEVEVTVTAEVHEGLVYADCAAQICANASGLTSHIGTTVVAADPQSWGIVKAIYR
jgi:hypothetical protein